MLTGWTSSLEALMLPISCVCKKSVPQSVVLVGHKVYHAQMLLLPKHESRRRLASLSHWSKAKFKSTCNSCRRLRIFSTCHL
jgi:hypothetical protein